MSNENSDDDNIEQAENTEKTSIVPSDTFKLRMEEAQASPPTLVLLMGPLNQIGKQWKVTKDEVLIGRLTDCDIYVDDRSISRRHAVIRKSTERVTIEDMGSSNGTEVMGQKLIANTPVALKDNQQVKMGNVILKFLAEGNIEAKTTQETFDRAQIDPLTQIFNKRAFLEKVDEVFKKSKLTDTSLSCIVFDLDSFTAVNNTYGHSCGDYVLKELAAVVKNQLRGGDFFARYGGEEFVLLVTGGGLRIALELAERLRISIDEHEFNWEGKTLNITISAGVAVLEGHMTHWQELFDIADKASYKSKRNGKNQVSTF